MLEQCDKRLEEASNLILAGEHLQAQKIFQQLYTPSTDNYCTLLNYGVLRLQQGLLSQAKQIFRKCTQVDSYKYIGHYNLFLANCQYLQTSQTTSKSSSNESENILAIKKDVLSSLYLALSCILGELGEIQGDIRLCTRSLGFWEENSSCYVVRASLYEGESKTMLAENDYESAIYYDPENSNFYLKRAEFYWRHGRMKESNGDIKMYWEKKSKLFAQLSFTRQIKPKEVTGADLEQYDKILFERSVEISQLLKRIENHHGKQENKWGFNIISPFNLKKSQDDSWKVAGNMRNSRQLRDIQIAQSPIGDQKLNESSDPDQKSYNQESSKNISQEIEKLEQEIRFDRGVNLIDSQSQRQQTFLTAEIEKTSKEIEIIKKSQLLDVRSNNGRLSQSSATSRQSQRFITAKQLRSYTKIHLQIISAQFFDNSNKQQAKVYLTYAKQKQQTNYSANYFWRTKLDLIIDHSLHNEEGLTFTETADGDEEIQIGEGEIVVELEMKSKSIWSTKKIVGKGSINIQRYGENKCVLSNQKQKVGIVYYKTKFE